MKILAIDSSGLVASVAITEDDTLLGEYTVNFKKTHSQTLLPMIAEVTKMLELDKSTIDAIAVSGGPGSFTGLRIGSATAKGIGLALEKPLIHVPTLDALAYNLWGTACLVCPIMDARRQQVYTGIYEFSGGELKHIEQQCAIGIDDLIGKINTLVREVVFLGDGVEVFAEYIAENCRVPYHFAPAHMNRQKASSVAALGKKLYEQGDFETAADHKPDYLRPSQAEREREEKERDFRI